MQGFFSDRGVLERQRRDTDASNGEVGADRRQALGPDCGPVFKIGEKKTLYVTASEVFRKCKLNLWKFAVPSYFITSL
jgi:hypothetical protein